MTHKNYHEVSAQGPAELGHQLGKLFGGIVRGYIDDERNGDEWEAMREEADLLLAATGHHFPDYLEELDAYAAAARVSLRDLWTLIVSDELGDDDSERCTTVVTNGGRLIGHNEDWDASAADDICILKKTYAGVTTLELYYYGAPLGGSALSISSRGYVQAINSLNHSDWQAGVPKLVIGRRLSELHGARTEIDAVMSIPRSSGFAHILVDHGGMVTAVECTATRHAVAVPSLPFVHTNHMLLPDLQVLEDEHDGPSTYRRYEAACRFIKARMGQNELIAAMDDRSGGNKNSLFNANTIGRIVADLDAEIAKVWLRRESSKGWISYPIDFFSRNAGS